MEVIGGRRIYSASDLDNFLECLHLTELAQARGLGDFNAPQRAMVPASFSARGRNTNSATSRLSGSRATMSANCLREYRAQPRRVPGGRSATRAAMERGHDYIYQASFFDGAFQGRADFLDAASTIPRAPRL